MATPVAAQPAQAVALPPLVEDRRSAWVLPAQAGLCRRRMGPFASQQGAFNRRNTAARQGFRVSGVYRCGVGNLYCFNVFVRC